ncbi:HK97 family phage prohead protease [Paenibacillus sp. HJGM_3]|uniref:HK97 family phage prohead protease n=1 Tax=Paenibacillus sp. HJGM_3 TaxID=3379816 RepID=UPI00385AA455
MNKERRTLMAPMELRKADDGTEFIEAYALKFGRESDNLGWYTPVYEKIDAKALDNADMSNVVALFNHNSNLILGRNTVASGKGRVELEVDGIGLKWRCTPTDTTYSRDLLENMRAGVVNQCSFAFSLDMDDDEADLWAYNKERGAYERTIMKIERLYDVSVVTTPAYPDTEAVLSQRSKDKIESLKRSLEPPKATAPDQRFFDYLKIIKSMEV